jgi:pyrophosphatase PpaX
LTIIGIVPSDHRLAILFDLDGTLVDTVPFILAAVRHAFLGEEEGRCPTDAQWIAGIGTPLRTQLESFARGPEHVDDLLARYRAFWLAEHDLRTRCFPGALETVSALARRRHPLAVVTAKVEEGAHRTLRLTGLDPHMGAVIGADSCARAKPDPEPVRLALARLGRSAGDAAMIGDSPHDLAAGRGAGVITIAALWGACTREVLEAAGPDHLLEDISALPALLERIEAGRDLTGTPPRAAVG